MAIADTFTDMQTAAFEQLVATQTRIVEMNRDLANRLSEVTEKLPAVPMMDEAIEANRSMVDNLFTWSAKLVEANRTFTTDLLAAWTAPVPTKSAASSSPVAAAAKAPSSK